VFVMINGKQEEAKRELFQDWMTSYSSDSKYDIFSSSYRVNPNSNRVNLLHWCLLNGKYQMNNDNASRLPVVFLDQYCLEVGKPWDISFAKAMKNSAVFCDYIGEY